ncbi:ATP-grasp domain-containing protein [Algoriphagus mannitolivorans]|uniref:hypothetical protein n=1 Tax=Algoriphagus mannitolivorans TaxID=226504 RepID=UPI000410899C|nr:hypothetical protein [Algoriphagus mannitolivorans]
MKDIYIVTDYRGKLYSSVRYWDASLDLDLIREVFLKLDYKVYFVSFSDIIQRINDFKDTFVIYPSSEDPGGQYKGFIEDVVLALNEIQAKLIPPFPYLRAHHNKVFMELFRKIHLSPKFNILPSFAYGTYEDYLKDIDNFLDHEWVLKPASGALSSGVKLLISRSDKVKLPKMASKSHNLVDSFKVTFKHLLKFRYKNYIKKSTHRNKFIVQKFIKGLTGDYKVLVYGDKFYVVQRMNRDNDFRASGGGKLNIEPTIPLGLLDFAHSFIEEIKTPFVSLDIAFDGFRFYLIEFQFLNFGNYTLEKSTRFFQKIMGEWHLVNMPSQLEIEFVYSIKKYIDENWN